MRTIDALCLYEHADRELDVLCALKCLAENKYGLSVEIMQHPYGPLRSDLLIDTIQPRVVFIPHAYLSGQYTPYLLDWPQATYINLMWEQLLYPGNKVSKKPSGKFCLEHVLYLAWGEFTLPFLHAAGVTPHNIIVNGNLTYTLYTEPYKNFYLDRAALAQRHHLDPNKKWLFFPENYNWAFYSDEALEGFIINGQKAEDVYAMRQFCLDSLNETFRWCEALAQQEKMEVIIRPRPFTSLERFTVAITKVLGTTLPPNLHIIKEQSVREWVLASDLTVSSYSTSLIEAAVAQKPAYMLTPLPIPAPLKMDWHNYIATIQTQEEFLKSCAPATPTSSEKLSNWTRQTLMSQGDAIDNLAQLLKQIVTQQRAVPSAIKTLDIPTPQNYPMRSLFHYHYWRLRRKYQHLSVHFKRQPVKIDPTFEKDLVSQAEIQHRVKRWKKVLTTSSVIA